MVAEGGFAHITVSSDDEDDFVIQAGVQSGFASDAREGGGEGPVSHSAPTASTADEPQPEPATVVESEPAPERADAAPEGQGASGVRGASADRGYRETTLEDLESAPMSSMQKGVIVAAVLAIAAFVLWYMVLR